MIDQGVNWAKLRISNKDSSAQRAPVMGITPATEHPLCFHTSFQMQNPEKTYQTLGAETASGFGRSAFPLLEMEHELSKHVKTDSLAMELICWFKNRWKLLW